MNSINTIKKKLKSPEYNFLSTNEHLGNNIILLTVGGSFAYGTNTENSDIDIRGVATNTPKELLTNQNFEQVINDETDTTIYSFNKFVKLITDCNPNTIELLGNRPEMYFYVSDSGRQLLDNRKMFLSQKCISTFGGYATAQLRRLQNALARDSYPKEEKEEHILYSMINTMEALFDDIENVLLYIDKDQEIHIKFEEGYNQPIRRTNNFLSQLTNIIRDYDKLNHRNRKKDDIHLNKHAMHLVRLYLTAIDLLEKEEIITHRGIDRSLLMSIRNGEYMNEDGSYRNEFWELISDLQRKFDYAKENTSLPQKPDYKKIDEFIYEVNEQIILSEK